MNLPPPLYFTPRSPRVQLDALTPAVLRFQDGHRIASTLQTVSFTGGLLSLPEPLARGSHVKLMFLAGGGSVLGGAEMLTPVSDKLQPFRFTSLDLTDRRRLGAVIDALRPSNDPEQLWIEKLRAASALSARPSRGLFRRAFGNIGFITLALGSVFYLLCVPLMR